MARKKAEHTAPTNTLDLRATQPPIQPRPKFRRWLSDNRQQIVAYFAAAIIMIAVSGSVFLLVPKDQNAKQLTAFPRSQLKRISGFTFYYFGPSFTTGYRLQPKSISYDNGVIVFELKASSNDQLAFTEEATPPGFDMSALKADDVYTNQYGQAYISDLVDRTTGALFTTDNTWILVNAPTPIGKESMEQILNALQPDH